MLYNFKMIYKYININVSQIIDKKLIFNKIINQLV